MIFGRGENHLKQVLEEIGEEGEVHGTPADVSRPADVRRVFEEVDSRLGDLEIAAEGMLPPEDVAAAILALALPERCDLVSPQLRQRLGGSPPGRARSRHGAARATLVAGGIQACSC
jgi:hypothetical protein